MIIVNLETLRQYGLANYAEQFFTEWFESQGITDIDYEEALSTLKNSRRYIESVLEEANVEESYDFYLGWFQNLTNDVDFLTKDNNHSFLDEWLVDTKEFTSLEEAKTYQDVLHEQLKEARKQQVTISAVTANPDASETYKSVNLIDAIEPEEADFFEYTVQQTAERRRTTSPTLAAIGLYEQKAEYDILLKAKPSLFQKIKNGKYTAWTQIA